MSLPEHLKPLLQASAYDHPCAAIELVETHISWVILTGDFAYKLKKPVRFAFVDFSTLERREHFCREELRCNRQFAPSLYVDVVRVARDRQGDVRMAGAGELLEWAVKMRQFAPERQLDRLLAGAGLEPPVLESFGALLARQHRDLPARRCAAADLEQRVLRPVADNFDDIAEHRWTAPHGELLRRVRAASDAQARRHRAVLERRLSDGWIRECHGDLHLSNMVLLESGVVAFDCLEFNEELRWIDPQNDTAFLFMDCLVRERADLAYAFVDGYLDGSGDYEGATLLPFYAAYRSMVRAKVAVLRREQADDADAAAELESRMLSYLQWSERYLRRAPGRLVLMCGLSGSGKSYLARRLVPRLPAIRLRSDVARKALAGLAPRATAANDVGEGLYSAARSDEVYQGLARVAEDLLVSGEHVIVDATFLDPQRREAFLALARQVGSDARVVYCAAPLPTLRARIRAREAAADDPSDAGLEVLEHQRRSFVEPGAGAVRMDTGAALTAAALDGLVRRLGGAGTDGSG